MQIRIIILATVISACQLQAQDSRFTQAYANPLRLNPALMGANYDLKAALNYRSQWASLDKGYNTYSFSLLSPVYLKGEKEKLDIGFNVNSDSYGAFKATDLSLSIGYTLKLSSNNNLSAALQYGYMQKLLSTANLTFDEQYVNGSYNSLNPVSEIIPNNKNGYSDVGFGLLWYYNGSENAGGDTTNKSSEKVQAYAGVSGFHLNRPNESFMNGTSNLPMKFSYIGGIKITGEKQIDFTPNVRITQQQGATEIAAGLYMDYRINSMVKFVVGSWYRTHDAIAFAIGIEHKSFSIGYSYDAVIDLNSYVAGANANEISLSYKFNMTEKKGIKTTSSPIPIF